MLSLSEEYRNLAYKKALLNHLIQHVTATLCAHGGTAEQVVICGDVPGDYKEVSQEAVQKMLDSLNMQEAEVRVELSKFEIRRKDT